MRVRESARTASWGVSRLLPWLLLATAGCAGGSAMQTGNPGGAGSVAGQTVELETMIVPYPLGHWDSSIDESTQTVRFAQLNQTNPDGTMPVNESVVIGAVCDTTAGWTEDETSYAAALARVEEQLAVLPAPLPPGTGFDSTNFSQVTVNERVYRQFDYSRQVPVDRAGELGEEIGRLYVYLPPGPSGSTVFYLLISKLQASDADDASLEEIEVVLEGFIPMP